MSNATEFERSLKKLLVHAKEGAAEKGMAHAGFLLLRDMIMEDPSVPLEEGTLRGSGSVFVGDVMKGTSATLGFPVELNDDGDGSPASSLSAPKVPDEIEVTVGLNVPYAEYQERGSRLDGTHVILNNTHSGTGPGFLRAKLEDAEKYYQGAADVLRRELKKKERGRGVA